MKRNIRSGIRIRYKIYSKSVEKANHGYLKGVLNIILQNVVDELAEFYNCQFIIIECLTNSFKLLKNSFTIMKF